MEAISHAGTVLGVLATDGVVLAAEKKVTGKLLDLSEAKAGGYGGSGEKIFLLNSYVSILSRTRAVGYAHSQHEETSSEVSQASRPTLIRSSITRGPPHSSIYSDIMRISPSSCSLNDCVISSRVTHNLVVYDHLACRFCTRDTTHTISSNFTTRIHRAITLAGRLLASVQTTVPHRVY
jgi:Proteasome subunit